MAVATNGASAKTSYGMSAMRKFQLQQFVSIEDLIDMVREKQEREVYYAVYSETGDDFEPGDEVFVDSNVQVNDNDEEIYPAQVVARRLRFAYSGEQFQDVVDLGIKQKPSATHAEIIGALNHYSEHDDFLDL